MDFYTILKPEFEKICPVLEKNCSDCQKKLAKTEQRLSDEKALLVRLQEHKENLMNLADESVADDQNSFEKFKVSLKKRSAEIESAKEAVEVLETKIIPAQRKEVVQANQKFASELKTFCLSHKGACEVEMTKLLDEIVKLQDSFFDACDRFCADYGFRFNNNDCAFNPEPKHKRIESLSIIDLSARQSAAAMEAPTMAVEAPVEAAEAPVEVVEPEARLKMSWFCPKPLLMAV
jgi:hypothetical protein